MVKKLHGLLEDDSMITAGHVADNIWKVALNKPRFKKTTLAKLLEIEKKPRSPECCNILASKAIGAFARLFDSAVNKDEILDIVKRQLKNRRNATRKKAEVFLKRFG